MSSNLTASARLENSPRSRAVSFALHRHSTPTRRSRTARFPACCIGPRRKGSERDACGKRDFQYCPACLGGCYANLGEIGGAQKCRRRRRAVGRPATRPMAPKTSSAWYENQEMRLRVFTLGGRGGEKRLRVSAGTAAVAARRTAGLPRLHVDAMERPRAAGEALFRRFVAQRRQAVVDRNAASKGGSRFGAML